MLFVPSNDALRYAAGRLRGASERLVPSILALRTPPAHSLLVGQPSFFFRLLPTYHLGRHRNLDLATNHRTFRKRNNRQNTAVHHDGNLFTSVVICP